MSTLLQRLNARLPFTKSERIIIMIVLTLHALPALEFIHISTRPPKVDDDRVMANLVSPSPAKSQEAHKIANKLLLLLIGHSSFTAIRMGALVRQ